MENTGKVTFIHSISAKIVLLTVAIVLICVFGSLTNTRAKTSTLVSEIYAEYILSMADTASSVLDKIPADMATDEEYENVLKDIKMDGIDSSYAYLVSSDGTMLYHPTAEKIGQSV